MEDKELLIRLTVLSEEITKKVTIIEGKVNGMNDTTIRELGTAQAVTKEKVSRLESIIYGTIAVIFIQIIALLALWLQKK